MAIEPTRRKAAANLYATREPRVGGLLPPQARTARPARAEGRTVENLIEERAQHFAALMPEIYRGLFKCKLASTRDFCVSSAQ
jgi:hypothetical protein